MANDLQTIVLFFYLFYCTFEERWYIYFMRTKEKIAQQILAAELYDQLCLEWMNEPKDPEAAETVQTESIKAVDLPELVRLFNEYGSTTGSDHADAIDKIMDSAMDKLAVYLAENNVCPRDAMGYCVMIVTQHLSAYGLRRAMGMKRRERESRSLPNA
jgi:hypothetical protein